MLRRAFWWFFCSVAISLLLSNYAFSQEWPEFPIGPGDHEITRGPGGYLSWIKLLLCWLLFLFWVRTTDWVSRDTQTVGLPYTIWNLVAFLPFLLSLLVFAFSLPIFPAGFFLTVMSVAVPLGIYVVKRNAAVAPHERVMTPRHIRFMFSNAMKPLGVKIIIPLCTL